MSTITASYHKLAHGRHVGTNVFVAVLMVVAVVLIVAVIVTTLSETSPQTHGADLLPLVREPVVPVPVPMPPARDIQPSLTATPAPLVKEWSSPPIPLPLPVPTP